MKLPPQGIRTNDQYFHDAASAILLAIDPYTAIVEIASYDPETAKRLARKLVWTNHNDKRWAHNLIGNILYKEENYEAAVTQYETALRIEPRFATVKANLAEALLRLDRVEDARRELAEAGQIEPGLPIVLSAMASLALADGAPEQAVALLERAHLGSPMSTEFLDKAGQIQMQLGNREAAVASWRKALDINPADRIALPLLAFANIKAGRFLAAEAIYTDAARSFPNDATVQGAYARFLYTIGAYGRSIPLVDRAIALAPDSPEYRVVRSYALARLGRNDEALTSLDEAEKLDPGYSQIYLQRGSILRAIGQVEPARSDFLRYLAMEPESEVATQIEEWLESVE